MTTKTVAELYAQRFGHEMDKALEDVSCSEVVETLLSHRTHRRFKPDPVSDTIMEMIFACAYSAPSKSDLQQATVIRVIDENKREAIASLISTMPWIGTAPEFMVFCGDSRRIREICDRSNKLFANDHLDAFFNATVDAAITMQNMIIAAEASGLGACPISVIRNHATKVSDILALPRWVFPVAGLCLGYPLAQGFISMRLPLSVTVHVDGYDEDALEGGLDNYDRRRDASYSIPEEKKKYVDDYGKADFYGWSEDKARQVSKLERDGFGAFIRGQGFILD